MTEEDKRRYESIDNSLNVLYEKNIGHEKELKESIHYKNVWNNYILL